MLYGSVLEEKSLGNSFSLEVDHSIAGGSVTETEVSL